MSHSAFSSAAAFVRPPAPDTPRIECASKSHQGVQRSLGLRDVIVYNGAPSDKPPGRHEMAVDGDWNITLSTPMGERKTTLSVKTAGGTLSGTQGADGNSTEIFDGTASGDDVNWKVS